jgi:branched-subunit amino acid transport protein
MSEPWLVILGLIGTTAVIRASGPVVLGGRDLPPRLLGVIALLASALLAALVVTETFATHDRELVLDERAAGVGGAAAVLARRGSVVIAVAVAAALTAAVRAI